MAVDKNKKRVILLTHDQIVNLNHLARMHLDEEGAPLILQKYPISEEYAESLRTSIESMEKVLDKIWSEEEDGRQ